MSQPPKQLLAYATPPNDLHLKEIARWQRAVLICILCYLILVLGQFALPANLRLLLALPAVGISITATVFVFFLATKIYSVGLGIVMGILTLVPCLGLIILLVVNAKATTILRANGYRVGLLGASLKK